MGSQWSSSTQLSECQRCKVPLLPKEVAAHKCERRRTAIDFLWQRSDQPVLC